MQAGVSPARPARARHRHELRTLTYVTLDQANGGIVRNLSHEGIAVQAVAAVRAGQQLRVHFELRYPRLRVETRGEVMWATPSGQCGIRFLDLPPRMVRQINEWIFGNLLESSSPQVERAGSMFGAPGLAESRFPHSRLAQFGFAAAGSAALSPVPDAPEVDDGLLISPAPLKVIELQTRPEPPEPVALLDDVAGTSSQASVALDWLSQPLSGRGLAWTINALVVVAALLLFGLVFLSVIREPPKWPLAVAAGAAIFVAVFYWGFFQAFGGASLGARLARLAGCDAGEDEEDRDARFR